MIPMESTVTSQPAERSLHAPASRQHLKGVPFVASDDLDGAAPEVLGPLDQNPRVASRVRKPRVGPMNPIGSVGVTSTPAGNSHPARADTCQALEPSDSLLETVDARKPVPTGTTETRSGPFPLWAASFRPYRGSPPPPPRAQR